MEFWLTDGVLHRAGTLIYNFYGRYVPCYEDTGEHFDIPDDTDTIIVPEGTIEIGKEAFSTRIHSKIKGLKKNYWPNAKKVVLPDSVKRIEDSAFSELPISEINLPEGLESIGYCAFSRTNLESVILPDSLKKMGSHSFFCCKELREITFPKSFVFASTRSTSPVRGVCYTPVDCLEDCQKLETINIKDDPNNYFKLAGCHSIKKAFIPDDATELGYGQYKGCLSLEEIILPETMSKIGELAFENCVSLTEITIPARTRTIDATAFKGCTGLRSITIKYPFKGFETVFSDATEVEKVFISDSALGKAKVAFPRAQIYNHKGKLLYAPKTKTKDSGDASSTAPLSSNATCPALNGELIPKSGLNKFTNYECFVAEGQHSFHIKLKGSQTGNRICKACYSSAVKGETSETLYDSEELMKENVDLYYIEPHSGILTEALNSDYALKRYSTPLNASEIIEYVKRFTEELASCLTEDSIKKIVEYVPHKKNGTFTKNRLTLILRSGWADATGYSLALIANSVSDTELNLEIQKMYIGKDKYSDTEAARVMGFVGAAMKRHK